MTTRLLLLAFLALTACASEGPDDSAPNAEAGPVEVQSNETAEVRNPEPDAEAAVDTTGPVRIEVAGTSVPTRGVVTDIQSGDVSCYIVLRTDGGATETVHADYSVCDSNRIIDRRVQVEYVENDVMAASCEGDPTCLDTETVALAVVAEVIE